MMTHVNESRPEKRKFAILVSGSGTNMENIVKRAKTGELNCRIAVVVSDQPNAYALERAKALGVESVVIERKHYGSKKDFEQAMTDELKRRGVDAVLLAGFMRILGPDFVGQWRWRILNIHPSLLPEFPGAQAICDAFHAKVEETGVTVHFVDEGVDSGPVIIRRKVMVNPGESLEELEARVHQVEYDIYPEAIRLFMEGKCKSPAEWKDQQ
jgi:phosphoribosylglycinamide formyltransferase 1